MGHKLKFRPDIEGLRGIAVLLVVLYHAGVPWIRGGFVGVDVFFVLSGYLITRLLVDEATAHGRINLLAFYARRARRLLPAAALTITATLVVGWFVLAPLTQLQVSFTALAAATYWSNLHFAVEAGDYFGQALARNPLLHTWSLAVEEQFYLAWPLLVAGAVWIGRRWRGVLVGVLLALTVASFLVNLWATAAAPHWAFFGTHMRAWEFGVGALAGLVTRRITVTRPALGAALGWVGLAAVVSSGMLLTEVMPWPGELALLPVMGTALVLASGVLAPSSGLSGLLGVRPLQVLGRLSYTWYLWHWPALVLVEAAAGPLPLPLRLGVAFASLLLSWVTHYLVENPVRFHPRLVPSARRSLAVMLFVTASVVGLASGADALARRGGELQARFIAASRDLARSSLEGCNLPIPAVAPDASCVYGVEAAGTTVVLLGDSHATQWFPAVEQLALEDEWRLVVHTKSGCTIADVEALLPAGQPFPECGAWREAVLQEIEATRPDLVIATTYAAHPHTDAEAWSAGLVRSMRRLAAAGPVVYVKDTPTAGFDVPECLSRWAGRSEAFRAVACGFARAEALAPHGWEREALAEAGVPVLDFTSVICPDAACELERGGLVIYRDAHHLTAGFARSLAPVFGAELASVLRRSLALNLDENALESR